MRRLLTPLAPLLLCASTAGAQWLEEARVRASDGAAFDQFGESLALSGTTLLVGAGFHDVTAISNAGAGYVYEYDGASWNETAELVLDEPSAEDFIGRSVALEGDLAVMGAFRKAATGLPANGAAVFVRSGGAWAFDTLIKPPDDTIALGGKFGSSIDLSGNSIVIGAKRDNFGGTAYVYTLAAGVWTYEGELAHSAGASSRFGQAVAISGDRLVVGAPNDGAGSAWVYERTGSSWFLTATLVANNGVSGDQFGISVDVDQDAILVGANFDNTSAGANSGSARVFRLVGSAWAQEGVLLPADLQDGDHLGRSVALEGDTALVGSWRDDQAPGVNGSLFGQGSAYVFTRSGTNWTEAQKLTASSPGSGDRFGFAVDLEGDLLAIGAPRENGSLQDSGAAYVFRSGSAPVCASCARHCQAGVTALGCSPLLSGWGTPSASFPQGFTLLATGLEPGRASAFVVSASGRAATPFGGGSGLLCVAPPAHAGVLRAVGAAAARCGASLRGDLTQLLAPLASAGALGPGTTLQTQLWSYAGPAGAGPVTSDALELVLQP